MENVIIVVIMAAIIALAVRYVVKAKKSGRKCVGCPDGCCPSTEEESSCGCGCGCGSNKT